MIKLSMTGEGLSFDREVTPAQAADVIKFLLAQPDKADDAGGGARAERPPERKSGKGCPECGSPSRHKATCSVGKKKTISRNKK